MTDAELAKRAVANRAKAYAPYSGFTVGAALLAASGRVYDGANVENAALTPGCCAERTALYAAAAAGEREFAAIAVAGGRQNEPGDFCYPCGVCRQALSEFCGGSFKVIVAKAGEHKNHTLGELLPHGFGKGDLGNTPQ